MQVDATGNGSPTESKLFTVSGRDTATALLKKTAVTYAAPFGDGPLEW